MAVPTPNDVKLIKPTVMSDPEIQARINTALIIVTNMDAVCDTSFTQAELDEIQLWVSAHLVSITEKNAKRENMLQTDMDVTYQTGTMGTGIMSTVEGQTANMLASGCLSQLDQMQSQIVFV